MRILLAAIAVTTALAADDPKSEAVPQTLSTIIDSCPTAIFTRCLEDQQIVAVYCEQEPQWWGRLAVYHRSGDSIDWQFAFPKLYEEHRGHYVVRFRWISLRQTSKPVLEVIESTHMGNGSLRIWEADGRGLRLLLDTVVRGRFWSAPPAFGVPEHGEAHFEGDHLGIEYRRSADQAADSILLTGSVRIEDIQGRPLPSRRFEQTCLWDSTKRVFVVQTPISP